MSAASIQMPIARARSACKRLAPCTLEPRPEDWAEFDEGERQTLEALLRKPVEYIDHPGFHLRGSKRRWLGPALLDALDRPKGTSLSPEAERALFLAYNYARFRQARILKKHAGRRVPAKQLRSLLAWARRVASIRAAIIEPNLPLVLAMIKRNRLLSLDFNELVSEGNLALLRCVDKFDCSRGNKFSTYACRSILKSFARVALRTGRYRARFPYEFDPALEKGDVLEECRARAETTCLEEVHNIMRENRAALSDVELRVIRARFLADRDETGSDPQTLEQIGTSIGVTKERVRQIQLKALRKLRLTLEDSLIS